MFSSSSSEKYTGKNIWREKLQFCALAWFVHCRHDIMDYSLLLGIHDTQVRKTNVNISWHLILYTNVRGEYLFNLFLKVWCWHLTWLFHSWPRMKTGRRRMIWTRKMRSMTAVVQGWQWPHQVSGKVKVLMLELEDWGPGLPKTLNARTTRPILMVWSKWTSLNGQTFWNTKWNVPQA